MCGLELDGDKLGALRLDLIMMMTHTWLQLVRARISKLRRSLHTIIVCASCFRCVIAADERWVKMAMVKSAASGLRGEAPEDILGEAPFRFGGEAPEYMHGGPGSSLHGGRCFHGHAKRFVYHFFVLVVDYAGRASFVHFYEGLGKEAMQKDVEGPGSRKHARLQCTCGAMTCRAIYLLILVFVAAYAGRVPFVHLRSGQEKKEQSRTM